MRRPRRARSAVRAAAVLLVLAGCHHDPGNREPDPFRLPGNFTDGPAYVAIPFEMGWATGFIAGLPLVPLTFPISLAWPDEGAVGAGFFRREGGLRERTAVILAPTTACAWGLGFVTATPFYLVTLPVQLLWTPEPPPPSYEPPAPPPAPGPPAYLPAPWERD